jgi:hypothetical protein
MADDEGFLSRWSKRKRGVAVEPPAPAALPVVAPPAAVPAPVVAEAPTAPAVPAPETPPPPTLDDVAQLPTGADVVRFVARDVDPAVKNAALKKLFADPHFNVMDGLDTYIDDYGKPDPLPASMLRKMASAHALGLFREEEQAAAPAAADNPALPPAAAEPTVDAAPEAATEPDLPPHEDAAVQLQPDDAAGPRGAGAGADEDPGRQP